MKEVVITDTGFWLGLFTLKDDYTFLAEEIENIIKDHIIIFPFPCLYETINTKFTRKNRDLIIRFEEYISRPNVIKVDDNIYREKALKNVFEGNRFRGSSHSFVDSIIREMILDDNIKIDYLVTFNEKDFIDVCNLKNVVMYK